MPGHRLLLPFVGLLASLSAAPSQALIYPAEPAAAAAQYLQLREALKAEVQPAPGSVAACDLSLRGKVIELRGRLLSSVTWSTPTGGTQYLYSLQTVEGINVALQCQEPLEGVRLDEPVRVLASLITEGTSGEFRLHGVVRESDLPEERPVAEPPAEPPAAASPVVSSPAGGAPSGPGRSGGAPAPTREPVWDGIAATGSAASAYDLPEVGMSPEGIAKWKAWVAKRNPKLSDVQLELVVRWVIAYSAIYGIDHRLSFAMIEAESSFNPMCLSHAGAMGMTQLMPCNLKDMEVDNPWNVQQNIRGGIRLLSEELRKFAGRSNYEQCILGLAAYNAGPNAVKKYGGVPPYKETQNYVRKVSQRFYELVQSGYP